MPHLLRILEHAQSRRIRGQGKDNVLPEKLIMWWECCDLLRLELCTSSVSDRMAMSCCIIFGSSCFASSTWGFIWPLGSFQATMSGQASAISTISAIRSSSKQKKQNNLKMSQKRQLHKKNNYFSRIKYVNFPQKSEKKLKINTYEKNKLIYFYP